VCARRGWTRCPSDAVGGGGAGTTLPAWVCGPGTTWSWNHSARLGLRFRAAGSGHRTHRLGLAARSWRLRIFTCLPPGTLYMSDVTSGQFGFRDVTSLQLSLTVACRADEPCW
jgi:hypothetical protein